LRPTLREREVAALVGNWPRARSACVPRCDRSRDRYGKFSGTVQLSSGKFALIEQSHEFTMVPWLPRHRPSGRVGSRRHPL